MLSYLVHLAVIRELPSLECKVFGDDSDRLYHLRATYLHEIFAFCLANLKKNLSVNCVSVYGDLVPHWQSKGNLIKGEKAEAHDAMRAESQLSDIHTHLMIKENI